LAPNKLKFDDQVPCQDRWIRALSYVGGAQCPEPLEVGSIMLKVLRENLKSLSWILWLVIAVFVLLVFVDFGGTVPGGSSGTSETAVEIGNQAEITYGEFREQLQRTEGFYRQIYGDNFNDELARQLGIPTQALNSLISERILEIEAEEMGLAATDEEVREEVLNIGAFLDEQGRFVGADQYEQILRANRATVDGFEEGIRQSILTGKLRSILSDNVYVSNTEIEDAYREQVERAKIEFVQVRPDLFADDVTVDDSEVQAYWDSNKEDFRLPERRAVRYLLVDREEVAASMELADNELEAYYTTNAADYAREEQVRARHILLRKTGDRTVEQALTELEAVRGQIEGGEDFETLAKEISEDPGSGAKGGDLGFFGRGSMVKPFEDASFSGQPGDLVGPIETAFGAHLIEVLERRPGGQTPFEEVREQIRSRVANERAARVAESRAGELAARMRHESAFSEEAQQAIANETEAVRLLVAPAFGRDDAVPGIGKAQPFSVSAFELQESEVSDPVAVRAGWAVLTLSEVLAPAVPPLADVENEVRELVVKNSRMAEAARQVAEQRALLDSGSTLADVADSFGLAVEESPLFGRTGGVGKLGVNREINDAALALDVDGIGGPIELADSVVLFRVTERQKFDPVEFSEEKRATRDRVVQQKANRMLSSLVQKRREELGVKIDPRLAADINRDPTSES